MPIFGVLHILVAIFFAVHAVRTHQNMYWLLILFMFPLLGSVVYFFAIFLPSSRLEHSVRRTVSAAARSLDPGRELREARQAFDLTPTAQNRMRLAAALLEAGQADKAAEEYEACLHGPFASDFEICFGAARARLLNGQGAAAVELLEAIRKENAEFRPEQMSLLLAQAYAASGRADEARAEFVAAIQRFGSFEARVEYAIWALGIGDRAAADAEYEEISGLLKHWTKQTKALNKPLIDRLESAFAKAKKS